MKNIELKNKAIAWLETQDRMYKTRPQHFTPSEVAIAINGSFNNIGNVAKEIVLELRARHINVFYRKIGNRRYFELI